MDGESRSEISICPAYIDEIRSSEILSVIAPLRWPLKKPSQRREGVLEARDELDSDGVIQRFEFCFELLWKTLKIFLADRGLEARSPKDSLKASFAQGWITDEEAFLDMLADRNKTSHIYSREESQKIFDRIKRQHLPQIEAFSASRTCASRARRA
jgi:nucleotidyltransferase substrate binding protein (TIGR01987 family)